MAGNPNDWDSKIQPLLYAYGSIPQESTGFSPFELLLGQEVHGPLDLLHMNWEDLSENDPESVTEYMNRLQNTLQRSLEIAGKNLKAAQTKQKTWYDRKAREKLLSLKMKFFYLDPPRVTSYN